MIYAMDDATRRKLLKLFAMMGSSNQAESDNARRRINEILQRHKKSWLDLLELLRPESANSSSTPPSSPGFQDFDTNLGPLDLLIHALQKYTALEDYYYLPVALWIVHTFVFERFTHAPRLALTSPVRGCGKTTVLLLLEALCYGAKRLDSVSVAALYRRTDRDRKALLLDEVDNYHLAHDKDMRTVLNSGHRRGTRIERVVDGEPKDFVIFVPVALALIGSLPLPLAQRSLVIHMTRASASAAKKLERFDETKPDPQIEQIYQLVYVWIRQHEETLDHNPPMPAALVNRGGDNWRPLFSIADACGEEWGRKARETALMMSRDFPDEDIGVVLLMHILEIFESRNNPDRIFSVVLVTALVEMEDAVWSSWRGVDDKRTPHKLTQSELAQVLRPFRIRPRSIRQRLGEPPVKGSKGYMRSDFENAWAAYCGMDPKGGGTPAQGGNIKCLRPA
jgi:hypothetical protein